MKNQGCYISIPTVILLWPGIFDLVASNCKYNILIVQASVAYNRKAGGIYVTCQKLVC